MLQWKNAAILAGAMLLGGVAQGQTADKAAIDTALIDSTLKGFTDSGKLVGVSALVFKDGQEVYSGAFGMADRSLVRQPEVQDFEFNYGHWALTPGAYGLVSTLDDYSRFTRMLLNGGTLDGVRILKPETIALMATDHMPADIPDANKSWLVTDKGHVGFGIDFAVRTAPPTGNDKAGEVGEFFWDGKADTLFWVDPKNHLTAVLFTQYMNFGKVPLHKAFRDAVYKALNIPSALPH